MSTSILHILLVDDHPMVLEGMELILKQMDDVACVGKAHNAQEAMSILRERMVNMVITDIHLPEINGIALCKRIRSEYPDIKVIAMSTFQDRAYISEMIQEGALGYISKTSSSSDIEKAIRAVAQNQLTILVSNYHATSASAVSKGPVLTRREKEVLIWIAEGLTNKEIADRLFVSQSTIDSHRKNLLHKFDVLNTAALVAKAAKAGLLSAS